MDYLEIKIKITPYSDEKADIVTAVVEDLPFESFVKEDPYLNCYMPRNKFVAVDLRAVLGFFNGNGISVEYKVNYIRDQDWNAVWESSFEPVVINGICTLKPSRCKNVPKTKYNIIVAPSMSFGTGHHQTTVMMIRNILAVASGAARVKGNSEPNLRGFHVMDVGTGTGVLAILAAKLRAERPVHAIDIDMRAVNSARESAWRNKLYDSVEVMRGDSSFIQKGKYDLMFANINRNTLIEDMSEYASGLKPACERNLEFSVKKKISKAGSMENAAVEKNDFIRCGGLLVTSGYYEEDLPAVSASAEENGFVFVSSISYENWCSAIFAKK
ncbi:MAG: 50S ribosomal protein L11 methyltransferase [Bacteroidales bacterium]|nr:50S ribosomal protein L11 methyltransferase [Bacteroidales bacterium]